MWRSEAKRERPEGRGIRRPMVWLALLWIMGTTVLFRLELPLRRERAAEALLKTEDSSVSGRLSGRLDSITANSGGGYSLTVSEALFYPDVIEEGGEAALDAGTALVYFPLRFEPQLGNRLEVQGSLSLFPEADNPGEFDRRAYYLAQNIACCMEADAVRITQEDVRVIAETARRVRAALGEAVAALYPADDAGVLRAMLLGERDDLGEDAALYETAGLSHLFSVSGLHVSFWALLIGRLCGFLLSFFPFSRGNSLLARRGYGLLRLLMVSLAIGFYYLLCGGRIPVRRAGLMAVLYQAAGGLGLSFDFPSALAFAALCVLVPAPYALFQSSFQLSFACVFILGCVLPPLGRRLYMETPLGQAVLAPILLQMGTLPITLSHFYVFRPYSVLANLLVVPLASFLLAGGLISALLGLIFVPAGYIAAGSVHVLLELIRRLCSFLGELPYHTVVIGQPDMRQILLYEALVLIGTGLALRIRQRENAKIAAQVAQAGFSPVRLALREARRTAILLFLWLIAAASVFVIRQEDSITLTSLYVGQGDCHVIRLPTGETCLLDGGTSFGDISERILLPYLRHEGIRVIDALIVSHCDADHINALPVVLSAEDIAVRSLILPGVYEGSPRAEALCGLAKESGIPVLYLSAGDSFELGEAGFFIHYPAAGAETEADNDSSLVLTVSCGSFDALFTGDLTETGERALLESIAGEKTPPLSGCEYLKVAHHGSKYSSTEAFLEAVKPEIAVISCGRNNRYGHPAPEALERLSLAGSTVCRTDLGGAVTVRARPDGTFTYSFFHKEANELKEENEKEPIGLVTWIGCGLLLAIGLALVLWAVFSTPNEQPEERSYPWTFAEITSSFSQADPHSEGNTEEGLSGRGEDGTIPQEEESRAESTWPSVSREPEEAETANVPVSGNAGRLAPEEDPQAAGYFFEEEATDLLYRLFAAELTNNTDEDDPNRGLSEPFKALLDSLSERYAAGELSAEELTEKLKNASFVWPNDLLQLEHGLDRFAANCYTANGRDMNVAREKILLTNLYGRHYLFLRVYYSEAENISRIYMVNGLVR